MSEEPKIVPSLIAGCGIQLACLSGWVALGQIDPPAPTKWFVAGAFLIGSWLVIYRMADLHGWHRLLLCCGVFALSIVGIQHALGFTRYPGLVKDIDPFSWGHLSASFTVFCIGFFGYVALATLARCVKLIARAFSRR